MENENEFVSIVNEYNEKLIDIFLREINITLSECKPKELGPVETYVNIINTLNKTSTKFGEAIGMTGGYEISFNDIPLPESVVKGICDYIDEDLKEAREEVKKQAEDVLNSETVGELMIKYNILSKTLDKLTYIDCIDSFADVEVVKKALTKNS